MKEKLFRWSALYLLPALLSISLLAACSDDDDDALTPLATPAGLSLTNTAATSLSFTWGSVSNAVEYYCVLYKGGTFAAEQTVTDPAATFSGLTPSTTYTLRVIAYAAINSTSYVESASIELEGRTADPIQLATPALEVTVQTVNATVAWEAVQNAASYDYLLSNAEGTVEEGNVSETTLAFSNLAVGDYTIRVTAIADVAEYADSETATETFTIAQTKAEEWRVEGTYLCGFDNSTWKATVVKYNDGTYKILNFYQGGYNMEFAPADGYANLITNWPDSERDEYFFMATGLSGAENYCLSFPKGYETYYNFFEGGGQDSGKLTYCYYTASSYTWCEDIFAWGAAETEIFGSDVQTEFEGTLYLDIDWDDNGEITTEGRETKTITLVDNQDGSYTLTNVYDGIDMTFTINDDNETITVTNATEYYGYKYYYDSNSICHYVYDGDQTYVSITEDSITLYWYTYIYETVPIGRYDYFVWKKEQ